MNPSLGNRLPVPAGIPGNHFFYRTALKWSAEDAAVLVDAVKRAVEDCGLHTAEIDVYSVKRLLQYGGERVGEAYLRLIEQLSLQKAHSVGRVGLLVCEWASPHVDDSFAGQAFLSLVLHTGPEPYLMQTFHSERVQEDGASRLALHTSTRVLNVGDAVVFDPTTPHMAAPASGNPDQLLIMLQAELPDDSEESRQHLLNTYPPLPGDRSQEGHFNGYE